MWLQVPLGQAADVRGMQRGRSRTQGGSPGPAPEVWESQHWTGVCQVRKPVSTAPVGGDNLGKGVESCTCLEKHRSLSLIEA